MTNDNAAVNIKPITPFNPLKPPVTIITIINGDIKRNGAACIVSIKPNIKASRPVTLAKVTVGIPIEPNIVGILLATRHASMALTGLNPNAINIDDGIATAVPNPAIPSRKPPKHQPINITRIRLSSDTDVIIFLITSMALV